MATETITNNGGGTGNAFMESGRFLRAVGLWGDVSACGNRPYKGCRGQSGSDTVWSTHHAAPRQSPKAQAGSQPGETCHGRWVAPGTVGGTGNAFMESDRFLRAVGLWGDVSACGNRPYKGCRGQSGSDTVWSTHHAAPRQSPKAQAGSQPGEICLAGQAESCSGTQTVGADELPDYRKCDVAADRG